MSVGSDRRLRWLSVAAVLVVLASVGVAGVGTVAVLSAVATAASGESVLLALLRAAVPFLLGLAALSVLGVALLAWVVVRAVRLAEVPRSDRLESVARGVERNVPWLEDGVVAEHVAPTVADRRDALKQRYADGELSEREFERELEALMRERGDPEADWPTVDAADAFDRELATELRGGDDGEAPSVAGDHGPAPSVERDPEESASIEREDR